METGPFTVNSASLQTKQLYKGETMQGAPSIIKQLPLPLKQSLQ